MAGDILKNKYEPIFLQMANPQISLAHPYHILVKIMVSQLLQVAARPCLDGPSVVILQDGNFSAI